MVQVAKLTPSAKRGGRRRKVEVREVLNGIMYVLSTGCQGRYVPKDLPPRSTLHGYLQRWEYDGRSQRSITLSKCREQASREASPTAYITTARA